MKLWIASREARDIFSTHFISPQNILNAGKSCVKKIQNLTLCYTLLSVLTICKICVILCMFAVISDALTEIKRSTKWFQGAQQPSSNHIKKHLEQFWKAKNASCQSIIFQYTCQLDSWVLKSTSLNIFIWSVSLTFLMCCDFCFVWCRNQREFNYLYTSFKSRWTDQDCPILLPLLVWLNILHQKTLKW